MREHGPSEKDLSFEIDSVEEEKSRKFSRRDFLKRIGKGVLAAGVLSAMPEVVNAQTPEKEL
jgi:hypothetical protein